MLVGVAIFSFAEGSLNVYVRCWLSKWLMFDVFSLINAFLWALAHSICEYYLPKFYEPLMTGAKRLQPRRLRGTPWSPTLVIFRVAVSAPSESLNSAKTWSAPWSFFSSTYWGVYKIGVEVSLGTFSAFRFRRIALRLNPILMVVGSRSSVSFNWSWGIVLCSQSLNCTWFCGWFD